MKKVLQWLCIGCAAAVVWWMAGAGGLLPFDATPLIEEKYAGWSGVLRVWVYEGWTGGDAFAGWLNRCAAMYEKRHNGVYVQMKYVDAAAIASLETSGVRPPDAIIFPPGLLTDAACLIPLTDLPVRDALAESGGGYAVPLLMGGYAWATAGEGGLCAAPEDERWRDWTAATEALGLPTSIEETPPEELPGIDLGLPAMADDSVLRTSDTLQRFVNGDCGAAAVGYAELKKLDRLREQGKGPDWTLTASGAAYTDQILYMSVTAGDPARESLTAELARHLLSDECQSLLKNYAAFTVTDLPSGYAAAEPRAVIELSLRRDGLLSKPAFTNADG